MVLTNRIIKVVSCFSVIAVILIASLTIPVNAVTPTVLQPADHLFNAVHYDDGTSLYFFSFWETPYYQTYYGSSLADSFWGSLDWDIDQSSDYYRLSVSPLGTSSFTKTPSCLIDISEFKASSVLELFYSGKYLVDVITYGDADLTFEVKSNLLLYWYDENLNYLGSSDSGVRSITGVHGSDLWVLEISYDMVIPDNASFVVPRYTATFYEPDNGLIRGIRSTGNEAFTITCKKDDIIDNSLTMDRIEKQLGGLNDKADTIIDGTPELQQGAQDALDKSQDVEQEFDDLMTQLDELGQSDTSTVMGAMQDFLEADGWKDLRMLVAPVLDWSHFTTIALIVLALVNLSIILFGR